jgi:uncharacterized protein (TIGR03086 family)
MSTNLRNFTKALYGMDHVVRATADDAWDQPSPCEGWNAAEALLHAAAVIRGVEGFARGAEVSAVAGGPKSIWNAARDGVLEALDQPGVLNKVVDSPFGTMPIDAFLGVIQADTLIHSWDVAKAVGGDTGLDSELVALAEANLRAFGDGLRGPGLFGPAIDTDESDDAQAAFLKFLGRQP